VNGLNLTGYKERRLPMSILEEGGAPSVNTLLIVDDDAINRKILCKIFAEDYAVQEAENGPQAIKEILADPSRFCAILLDVIMPGMDGIEVLRHLSKDNIPNRVPIFLITAETGERVVREAYELGVMDVIKKPVVSYVVLRRVNSIIELFEARKHLSSKVEVQSMELLKQSERIIHLNQGMIEALATAIEFRNEESGGHVQRISHITRIMLENTEFGNGLSKEEIDDIVSASIMHDVGKITIPDAVLAKPGRLTPEEFEIMKTHTTKGVSILERIPPLRDTSMFAYACDIALHHHERWNGGGYPDGLKGDEITPWAQVVSVADVYDALSCKRVYKAAFSRETVLEMIRVGACGEFNPKLLDAFFSVEPQLSLMYKSLAEAEDY